MKAKITFFLLFALAISGLSFGQVNSASATYSLGNIKADRSFGNPSQSSTCPGSLAVNIPVGATITSVNVVYDFEALTGSYKAFQVSELRCVSPGGVNEGVLATCPNCYTTGVLTYSRSNLNIANGVTGGGNILFELHAGNTFGSVQGCSEQLLRINNNTWTVTVFYLNPATPTEPINPNPANNAANVPINIGNLTWTFGSNSNYYDLYFGQNNPPTIMVVNNQVAGATGSYNPGTLSAGTKYYWKVVARSSAGNELAGPVWNFSTECLLSNSPININFDNLEVTPYGSGGPTGIIPLCWTMLYQNSYWYASQGVYSTTNAFSENNCWIMSNEGDPTAYNIMILPQMAASLKTMQLSFMAKGTGGPNVLSIGTMSDPNNAATYSEFTTISLSTFYQQFDISLSSYTGTNKYVAVKFTSPGANTYRYIFIDNVFLSAIPSCPRPKDLTAIGITQTTATVNWTETGNSTHWNIQVVPAGTSPTGNSTAITTKPYTITGLQPATSYDFYLQSDCEEGNVSYWSNKGTFKTACLANTVPLFENFDASNTLPACWSVCKTITGTLTLQTYGGYSLPNNISMSISSLSDVVMLVSPPLNVPGGNLKEVKLNFFAKRTASEQNIIVGTMSNPLDYTSFTPFKTINITSSNVWSEYEVWFNNYTGNDGYIAFKCGNLTNVGSINLDDINIGLLPFCLNPVDLWINQIHENDARLHWTESRVATNWQIEIGAPGFVPGTNNFVHAYTHQLVGTDYSFVMTGLEPGKFYDVYMRADCGSGNVSLWSPKTQFMSQPELYNTLPLTESFDPGFTYTTSASNNLVPWTLFSTLYHSAPNCTRNQYSASNNNSLVITKRFDLTNNSKAYLSFWHIAKTDGERDFCYVEISTDGGATYDQFPVSAYIGLGKYRISTISSPEGPCFDEDSYAEWGTGAETPTNTWWKNENFDLSAYSSYNNVVIRFRLVSDNSTNKYGWLIDDISIKSYDGPVMNANPLSYNVEIKPFDTINKVLTISNSGNFPVTFIASAQNYSDAITTILSQDFETGTPPDWTIINGPQSAPASQWQWAQSGVAQYNLNGTNYMFVGRVYPDTCYETLVTPAFSGVGFANVYLSFDQCYVKPTSSSVTDYAEVFVWNGTSWISVLNMKQINAGTWGNPDKPVIDITQYANPNMKVKFYYHGYSTSRWGVDNVKITASDIPVNWLTLDGKSSIQGLLQGGESKTVIVTFATRPSFPLDTWHSEIQIISSDALHSPINIPVSMTLGCPQPWQYTQTQSSHYISIPLNIAPHIFGTPLESQDWIGIFFLNGNGDEVCGGAAQWNGTSNININAQGDDPTTPAKDGFAAGEAFKWRLKRCGDAEQYSAMATYDPGMPNQGNYAAFGMSKLLSLGALHQQNYSFNNGWNSISSYVVPSNPAVENMFAPIVNNLTILKNLTALYWPSVGTNTIINWDNNSGYVIKVSQNTNFIINGPTYSGNAITIPAGWQYLPVLSQCPVNIMNMFGSNQNDIIIIQELIGIRVFWPAMQVYSLETLEPGKAYLIKPANEISVNFPICQAKELTTVSPEVNNLDSPWGNISMTPASQLVVFLPEATTNFVDSDFLGAFDQQGNIFGVCKFAKNNQNLTMSLYGDDLTSIEKDGFTHDEPITFKLLSGNTGDVFDLEIEYSPILGNTSGKYEDRSFAAISKIKMSASGIEDHQASGIEIFPNPTCEILNITGINTITEVQVLNIVGEKVLSDELFNSTTISVSSLDKGTYILRFANEHAITYKKLVIR